MVLRPIRARRRPRIVRGADGQDGPDAAPGAMEQPYSDEVMDHFTRPRNVGSMDAESLRVGTGVAGKPNCGDVVKLQIEVGGDERIVDAKFRTFGCGSTIAASSFTTEWIKGRSLETAGRLKGTFIAERLGLPEDKAHCSALAEDAAKAAIEDWKRKHGRADKANAANGRAATA